MLMINLDLDDVDNRFKWCLSILMMMCMMLLILMMMFMMLMIDVNDLIDDWLNRIFIKKKNK